MFGNIVPVVLAVAMFSSTIVAATPQPESWKIDHATSGYIETRALDALDLQQIAVEDAEAEAAGKPPRFAIPHEVSITTRDAGSWERDGDIGIWRYRVTAASAASLNFGFTRYRLPASARLYIYDADHRYVIGPYGAEHNEPHHQLWTPIVASSDVVIELDVAIAEQSDVELALGWINQGYRGFGTFSAGYRQPSMPRSATGAKSTCSPDGILSGGCNMDVACLGSDDPWNDPRRATGMLSFGGSGFCSGSLINNTANDGRMLFITASHCGLTPANSPSVVVYWNYESPTCRTPGAAGNGTPVAIDASLSNSGATFLSSTGLDHADTALIELDTPANPAFHLYWEGWDRSPAAATCGPGDGNPASTAGLCASIHHPSGDEKRITFVARDLISSNYSSGPPDTHWLAYWDSTPPILANIPAPQPASLPPGVTEGGSSGSPLFNADHRMVGVLTGGRSYCGASGEDLSDRYGKLAVAWEGNGTPTTRVKDYLDPLGTDVLSIGGFNGTAEVIFADGFDSANDRIFRNGFDP